MSEMDEILGMAAGASRAGSGSSEEHIVIGNDRYLIIPESLKKIAVQHDHNVETVTFDCPRYWDDIDFYEEKMVIYVAYMKPNGEVGKDIATNVTVDENDANIIHFQWTPKKDATSVHGYLSLLVCIEKTKPFTTYKVIFDNDNNIYTRTNVEVNIDGQGDIIEGVATTDGLIVSSGITIDGEEVYYCRYSSGEILYHWNSELCTEEVYISEGLDCMSEHFEKLYPDLITHLLTRMNVVEGLPPTVHVDRVGEDGVDYVISLTDINGTKTIELKFSEIVNTVCNGIIDDVTGMKDGTVVVKKAEEAAQLSGSSTVVADVETLKTDVTGMKDGTVMVINARSALTANTAYDLSGSHVIYKDVKTLKTDVTGMKDGTVVVKKAEEAAQLSGSSTVVSDIDNIKIDIREITDGTTEVGKAEHADTADNVNGISLSIINAFPEEDYIKFLDDSGKSYRVERAKIADGVNGYKLYSNGEGEVYFMDGEGESHPALAEAVNWITIKTEDDNAVHFYDKTEENIEKPVYKAKIADETLFAEKTNYLVMGYDDEHKENNHLISIDMTTDRKKWVIYDNDIAKGTIESLPVYRALELENVIITPRTNIGGYEGSGEYGKGYGYTTSDLEEYLVRDDEFIHVGLLKRSDGSEIWVRHKGCVSNVGNSHAEACAIVLYNDTVCGCKLDVYVKEDSHIKDGGIKNVSFKVVDIADGDVYIPYRIDKEGAITKRI